MAKFVHAVKSFLKEEDGPTMVEYGLLVALIAIVVAAAALFLGQGISTLFSGVGGAVSGATVPTIP